MGMKNIASIILLTLILSTSCNSVKVNSEKPYIQLTKKRCFGKCPVYDLFIYKNGNVRFNGIDNVKNKGIIEFEMSAKKFDNIKSLFSETNFKLLKSKPDKIIRDLPITELTFENKKVSFQGQEIPNEVKRIIKELESMVL